MSAVDKLLFARHEVHRPDHSQHATAKKRFHELRHILMCADCLTKAVCGKEGKPNHGDVRTFDQSRRGDQWRSREAREGRSE